MSTIKAQFNPKDLPLWAQKNQAVVERCKRDLAYRCNVCAAKTAQVRKMLIKQA